MKWLPLIGILWLIPAGVSEKYYYEVPYQGEYAVDANIDIPVGTVTLQQAEEGYLFQAEVVLAKDNLKPKFVYRVEEEKGYLRLALDTGRKEWNFMPHDLRFIKKSAWNLYLGNEAPIDLKLTLGVTESELNFTGVALQRLKLSCGAASAQMQWDAPNPISMEKLHIEVGASDFKAYGLGYSRAQVIKIESGVANLFLDFTGGYLPPGAEIELEVGVASVTVKLPEDQPVILELSKHWFFHADVPVGYTKKGKGLWYSPQVVSPSEAIVVKISGGVGEVTFE